MNSVINDEKTEYLTGKRTAARPVYMTLSGVVECTPCPVKKEASSFSTISLAFLDQFS